MFLRIEIDEADELGLYGRELLVYNAIKYLSKHQAWQGTMTDLAKYSRCGGKTTAFRMLESLLQKGLITKTDKGYSAFQNGTSSFQNGTESKEKRTKKENIKENNEVSVCINAREETHTGFAYRRSYK